MPVFFFMRIYRMMPEKLTCQHYLKPFILILLFLLKEKMNAL